MQHGDRRQSDLADRDLADPEVTRHVGHESERLKHGEFWQGTIGPDLEGKTLGTIGLGKLRSRVAKVARPWA